MSGGSVSALLSAMLVQGIKDIPHQELPADLVGPRFYFVMPPKEGQDGGVIGAVFNPPVGTRLEVDFGGGVLVFTNEGVALVLSGQAIDTIKQFGPEHARLAFAWNHDEGARDRVLAESFEVITNEEALAVREQNSEAESK